MKRPFITRREAASAPATVSRARTVNGIRTIRVNGFRLPIPVQLIGTPALNQVLASLRNGER